MIMMISCLSLMHESESRKETDTVSHFMSFCPCPSSSALKNPKKEDHLCLIIRWWLSWLFSVLFLLVLNLIPWWIFRDRRRMLLSWLRISLLGLRILSLILVGSPVSCVSCLPLSSSFASSSLPVPQSLSFLIFISLWLTHTVRLIERWRQRMRIPGRDPWCRSGFIRRLFVQVLFHPKIHILLIPLSFCSTGFFSGVQRSN